MKSYIALEKDFFKGPIGMYMISLYTLIKILLHDKGMMKMDLDN
jgi:hypothetical protein